jgi:hypothetical protein
VPPEIEWSASLTNPSTQRAHEEAVKDLMRFTGIAKPDEFSIGTQAHHRLAQWTPAALAWRQLRKLMAALKRGDVVIIPAVDRLWRDATDLLVVAHEMKSCCLRSAREAEVIKGRTHTRRDAGGCRRRLLRGRHGACGDGSVLSSSTT